MKLYCLNKIVLSIRNNAAQFLNGLASNTLDQPRNAFLTVHGRIVATFDQLKISDDEVWAVIEAPFKEDLLKHLGKYALLNKTVIEALNMHVYYDLEGSYPVGDDQKCIPQKVGKLILSPNELQSNISDEESLKFRLRNNIPVHGIDYKDELILNVDEHEFVSYTKGCFLGQEPVAKVHNRSKPSWKLVVRYEDELSDEEKAKMTSRFKEPSGRTMGFVFVSNQ